MNQSKRLVNPQAQDVRVQVDLLSSNVWQIESLSLLPIQQTSIAEGLCKKEKATT